MYVFKLCYRIGLQHRIPASFKSWSLLMYVGAQNKERLGQNVYSQQSRNLHTILAGFPP